MNSPIKELIHPLPGYTILHVSSNPDEIITTLSSILEKVGGRLNLAIYGHDKVEVDGDARVQYLEDYDTIFRALPRDHDIVILHEVFSKHQKKDRMLKNAYMTLANAAQIIIIEKKGAMDVEQIKEYLIQHEFRAHNEIDLLEGYDLVMAKKMHMWGNGL